MRARRSGREYHRRWESCPGAGMFGWIETQVHAKTVTRQLQTMFQMVRQLPRSVQVDVARSSMIGWEIGTAAESRRT